MCVSEHVFLVGYYKFFHLNPPRFAIRTRVRMRWPLCLRCNSALRFTSFSCLAVLALRLSAISLGSRYIHLGSALLTFLLPKRDLLKPAIRFRPVSTCAQSCVDAVRGHRLILGGVHNTEALRHGRQPER